jgi:hypothetical protein
MASLAPHVVGFTIRAGLLVLAGAVALTSGWPGPAGLAAQIVALAISVVLLAWWVPTDRRSPLQVRYAPLLPYGLAAMIIACGIASATCAGGVFNVLGSMAAFLRGQRHRPGRGVCSGWPTTG